MHRGLILVLSLGAGFLVFLGGPFAVALTRNLHPGIGRAAAARGIYAALIVLLLMAALAVRRKPSLRPYWRLTFGYFVASSAVMLSDLAGDGALILWGQPWTTLSGFVALKLGEDATTIGTIIMLAILTRDDREQLFLSRSRLGLGLAIGIASLVALTGLSVSLLWGNDFQPDRVRELLAPLLLVALADGFMEEMLFRGLFLRRLGRCVGDDWANVVTATVFAFWHLEPAFPGSNPVNHLVLFVLGLLLGRVMQRTGSVLAPALIHAGAIMIIFPDVLTTLGVRI